jgi:hypothetical protein
MNSTATGLLELRDVSLDARQSEFWAKRYESHQQRFLREAVPLRLGELASALTQVRAAAEHSVRAASALHFIETCLFYVEWTQPETDSALQKELESLRQQLIEWLRAWPLVWDDTIKRDALASNANRWSQKVIEQSGLLDPANPYAR